MYTNIGIHNISMELAKKYLSSPSPFPHKTHFRHPPSSSSSALMLHEQSAPSPMLTTCLAQHFPTSVLIQEVRDETKPLFHSIMEDKTSQVKATLDRRRLETGLSPHEEDARFDSDQYLKEFQSQLLHWYLLPSLETPSLSLPMDSISSKRKKLMRVDPVNVVDLAKKALSASKQAALLAEDYKSYGSTLDESLPPRSGPTNLADIPFAKGKTVRSTRRLERQSKRRGVPKQNIIAQESSKRSDLQGNRSKSFDPNDPLRLFLSLPETKQLLTLKEESQLIVQIKDLMRLEEVKSTLNAQFGREPTLLEWAEAVGLSSHELRSKVHGGTSSREKLIYANFRMVVHIAKQYQGRGLNLQDLMQEGSTGLMRSVEKFKPQVGCRFATYAYWWIRQSVRKAIFQHSRTIRLPDNVYNLLYKVTEAKRLCIQDGHHSPTKEDIAARAGITVEKLERLLFSARMPLSMQQPVWADQNTTFQQITADTAIETPDASVAKQLMRQHTRNLLGILSPKERKIMRLRYGIEGDKPKSLSDIGAVFGLSKERVRQLESRALYKLKQCLGSQGLDAYADLLV